MDGKWTGGGVLQLFEARGKVTKPAGRARCAEQVMLAICSYKVGHASRHRKTGLIERGSLSQLGAPLGLSLGDNF